MLTCGDHHALYRKGVRAAIIVIATFASYATMDTTFASPEKMSLPNSIFKRWVLSREEVTGENIVYRPAGYPLPRARGREGIEFRDSGEFIHYIIGPTDRSQAVTGEWKASDFKIIDVNFPNKKLSPYRLTIVECSDTVLLVKK